MPESAAASQTEDVGIMIDAPDTPDRDDALWVSRTETGFDAWVHIALVAPRLLKDGSDDLRARERIQTRYLPQHTVSMLPKAVEAEASLREDAAQPSLGIRMHYTVDGELIDCEVGQSILRQSWAISYATAAESLQSPEAPLHAPLADAHALATTLLARRQRRGALAFYDLFKGYATNEEGQLVRLGRNQRNSGYIIVQELMIAANSAIATWCASRDLPILFRNHRFAAVGGERDELMAELAAAEVIADPSGYEMLRKRMSVVQRPATYAPVVFGHHGLNLPAYAHTTSPLRRYPDLVNQRILLAATTGSAAAYSAVELRELAEELNARLQSERERRAERHRQQARQATRDRLVEERFDTLEPTHFSKVLRLALRQAVPAGALVAETRRRFESDDLPLRDACEVLFRGSGEAWCDLRQLINRHLAAEPGRALTVLSMYAQSVVGGPINHDHLRWELSTVGSAHQPRFVARLLLELDGVKHESPSRTQSSKKDAKTQAALALVAQMAEVDDLSASHDVPDDAVVAVSRRNRVPADRQPVMAVNEYSQTGIISDVTWTFTKDGPAHEPTFTCTVRATFCEGHRDTEASGTGGSKQLAKTAAAAQLWTDIDQHLDALDSALS